MLDKWYWILPNSILYNSDLNDKQKLLFVSIASLCAETWTCWAWNDWFIKKWFAKNGETITRNIKILEKLWYINIELEKLWSIVKSRKITIDSKVNSHWLQSQSTIDSKVKENNTSNKNTNINKKEIIKNISLEEMLEYKNNELTKTLYKIFILDNFKQSVDLEKFKDFYDYILEECSHKWLYFKDWEWKINAQWMINLVKKMLNHYQEKWIEIKNLKNCLLTFLK